MLYGREAEQAVIDDLLDGARAGRSGALVLRGEAGIGKSALLDYAAARGITAVRGAGIESEAELPFAALHLLLRPGMALVPRLPPRQREALESAFGLGASAPADRMLIGLAVLTLLAEETADGPLLVLIDDAHWLDRATAETLLFAARRLDAEGVVMLFAARSGPDDFPAPGLPELALSGLPAEASAALLDAGTTALSPTARYRLLVEAGGNPLALLELPSVLGAVDDLNPLPLTQRLQLAFYGRVARLPAATRTMLLVAAAAGTTDLAPILRAAARLGAALPDLQPAADAGLVRTDGQVVTWRHPLSRAAVYQGSALTDRLAAHRALAEAMTDPDTADLRAWHLASAATGSDEQAASALEHTADRARRRNGFHGAVAAYDRAAALSAGREARVRRLVAAAETATEAGLFEHAAHLADRAAAQLGRTDRTPGTGGRTTTEPGQFDSAAPLAVGAAHTDPAPGTGGRATSETGRAVGDNRRTPKQDGPAAYDSSSIGLPGCAPSEENAESTRTTDSTGSVGSGREANPGDALSLRLELIRAQVEFASGAPGSAHRRLMAAARASARQSPTSARARSQAAHGRSADPVDTDGPAHSVGGRVPAQIVTRAVHTAWYLGPAELDEVAELLATSALDEGDPFTPIARYLTGSLTGRRTVELREAAAAARANGADSPADLVQLCGSGLVVGQDEQVGELADELIAESREQGRLALLAPLLFFRAEAELFGGRPGASRGAAEEGVRIATDIGQPQWISQLSAFLAYLAALRGDEAACREHVDRTTAEEFGGARAAGAPWAHAALALLALGAGRLEQARAELEHMTVEPARHHVSGLRSLADQIEVAARLGAPAETAMAQLAEWSARAAQPWIAALVARGRALLAEGADAEPHFRDALVGNRPFDEGRTRLLYGEWLRRDKRKADARTQLEQALALFERLGAAPWSARARTELAALGIGVDARPSAGPLSVLTPQEAQIVRLAAQGLSNREIAARLVLSHRTVGHHLYKAYPKLGVLSRGELSSLELAE
ncbi:AAA family ATPase [Nocardia neocaledoniensis]|uniref:AAA family ATPase n=1 Tax=Nocardia neocaledoniensis TaxID=236511 RepID=UPI002455982D|nr:AAA family ATPase [Nocardia neocaledoniensis]